MQLIPPNGKIGASGLGAQPLVARDSISGLALALIRNLRAIVVVLEAPPK